MDPVQKLKNQFVATKLKMKWWNPRRAVDKAIKERFANAVDAQHNSIGGSKLIYNPELPTIKQINSLKTEITDYWTQSTRPYADEGTRLLPRDNLTSFKDSMAGYQIRLDHYARDVQLSHDQILGDARARLREAFREGDYPADLSQLYGMTVEYPNLRPSADLPPEIYEEQKKLAEAKLQEAVSLFNQQMAQQLLELVSHLHERLTPGPDGKQKILHASSLENLRVFFETFGKLNVGGHAELENAVQQAKEVLSGVHPKELRDFSILRDEVRIGMDALKDKLSPLVVHAPRRKILVPGKPEKKEANGVLATHNP